MSSTYWNSMDFDSEGTISTKNSSTSPRQYVDPWDLENYAYMRKRLDSHHLSSTPSAAGEPAEASFYYTPFDKEYEIYKTSQDPTDYYLDRDEVINYPTDRFDSQQNYYHQPYSDREELYGVPPDYSDMEDSPETESPTFETDGSLLYMYETARRCRTMVVPSSRTKSSSPNDIYGSQMEDIYYSTRDKPIPIYDDLKTNKSKPRNFSLSNYGHLKIDYSVSWNSLDRFIGK